jgi:hypothetical protein
LLKVNGNISFYFLIWKNFSNYLITSCTNFSYRWRANCRRNKAETQSVSTETIKCKPALIIIIIACIYITPNLPQTIQNKYYIMLNSYIWTADCSQRCVQFMCILFRLKLKELIISLPNQYILVVQVRLKTPTQILNKSIRQQ